MKKKKIIKACCTYELDKYYDEHHVEAHAVVVVEEAAVGQQQAGLVDDGTEKHRARDGTNQPGKKCG